MREDARWLPSTFLRRWRVRAMQATGLVSEDGATLVGTWTGHLRPVRSNGLHSKVRQHLNGWRHDARWMQVQRSLRMSAGGSTASNCP